MISFGRGKKERQPDDGTLPFALPFLSTGDRGKHHQQQQLLLLLHHDAWGLLPTHEMTSPWSTKAKTSKRVKKDKEVEYR
jgi:hypothetical protein